MSELREQRWSVLSERGCEAASVNYEEAAGLVRSLREGKVHGLCIVSDEAARRSVNSENDNGATTKTVESKPDAATVAAPPAKKRPPRRNSAKLS